MFIFFDLIRFDVGRKTKTLKTQIDHSHKYFFFLLSSDIIRPLSLLVSRHVFVISIVESTKCYKELKLNRFSFHFAYKLERTKSVRNSSLNFKQRKWFQRKKWFFQQAIKAIKMTRMQTNWLRKVWKVIFLFLVWSLLK